MPPASVLALIAHRGRGWPDEQPPSPVSELRPRGLTTGGHTPKLVLDDEVRAYLEVLQERTLKLLRLTKSNPATAADELAELENWFDEQFGVVVAKFRPLLQLSGHRMRS